MARFFSCFGRKERIEEEPEGFISLSDILVDRRIAFGFTGDVYLASWYTEQGDVRVALRSVKVHLSQRSSEIIRDEMQQLVSIRHPNVLQYMGICIEHDRDLAAVIMEFMPRGSLYNILHDAKVVLPWNLLQTVACDACLGMQYLHSLDIVHGNFKSPNLMIDVNWNTRVADYGLRRIDNLVARARQRNESVWTPLWSAPEVLKGGNPTKASDVYSFGIILWEVLTRRDPFQGMNLYHALAEVMDGKRPPIAESWHCELVELLDDCWAELPEERPTFQNIRTRLADITRPSDAALGDGQRSDNFSATASVTSPSLTQIANLQSSVPPPQGEVALLFVDIEDGDILWAEIPQAMTAAAKIYFTILRSVWAQMGGYEVKSEGDAVMVAFQDVQSALSACLRCQTEFLVERWPKELLAHELTEEYRDNFGRLVFRGLCVKMGIHTGSPTITTDIATGRMDYIGMVVNKAAHVAGFAKGGEVLLSQQAWDRMVEEHNQSGILHQSIERGGRTVHHVLPMGLIARSLFLCSSRTPGRSSKYTPAERSRYTQIAHQSRESTRRTLAMGAQQYRWVIRYSDLRVMKKAGVGSFGEVFKGKWKSHRVAIKRFHRQEVDERTVTEFCKDMHVLRDVEHVHLIQFFGACSTPPNLSVVTEYCDGGSVARMLRDTHSHLPWRRRLSMLLSVARGMRYLHTLDPPVLHGDLSTENILLDRHLNIKITDYGLHSMKSINQPITRSGSAAWVSPERIHGEPLTRAADIYSFAVVAWEFLALRIPYPHMRSPQIIQFVLDGGRLMIPQQTQDKEFPSTPPPFREVIERCWHHKQHRRLPFSQICSVLKQMIVDNNHEASGYEQPGSEHHTGSEVSHSGEEDSGDDSRVGSNSTNTGSAVLSPAQHPLVSSVQSEEGVTLNSLDTSTSPSSAPDLGDSLPLNKEDSQRPAQGQEKKHRKSSKKQKKKKKKTHKHSDEDSARSASAKQSTTLKLDVQHKKELSPRSRRRRDRRLKRSHTRRHDASK